MKRSEFCQRDRGAVTPSSMPIANAIAERLHAILPQFPFDCANIVGDKWLAKRLRR